MTRRILRAALFLLPVLILLPHLAEFPYQLGASYTDLAISHYPNSLWIQQSIREGRSIPLWSPLILSGYPFAADPLSGLFYPPGWLALLFPLPLGFNLALALHLIWGGVGMYRFLSQEGLGERPGLFGALVFEALPKLFSHIGAGHLTLVYAVSWTPWLLYAEGTARSSGRTRWMLPGLVLGTIALADVRWAPYAGIAWLAVSLRGWYSSGKRGIVASSFRGWIAARVSNSLFALLVAAALLLPLAQYTRLSTRSHLTPQDSLTLSLPPKQLLGLVYPNIGGPAEWTLYFGAIPLALSFYCLANPAARRRAVFWLCLAGITLLVALGSNIPLFPALFRLPGLSLLRVPPRALFLTGFALSACSAVGLDSLLCKDQRQPAPGRDHVNLVIFALAAFAALFAAAVWLVVAQPLTRLQFAWGALFFVIGAGAILLARGGRAAEKVLFVLLLGGALVDVIGVNGLSLAFHPAQETLAEGQALAQAISKRSDGQPFRVYSPSYSLPQQTAAFYHIELADGIDPLQLDAYTRFMEPASGVPVRDYSVTLPPYPNADPAKDNQGYLPDARMLGLLNVRYVVSAFPLLSDGLRQVDQPGTEFLYENTDWRPRAWVQSEAAPPGEQIQSRPIVSRAANAIELQAQGPGLLVLSELLYPGWQVYIDGQRAQIEPVGGLLRGARLGPGSHLVRFIFWPWVVYAGLGISLISLGAFAVMNFFGRNRHG